MIAVANNSVVVINNLTSRRASVIARRTNSEAMGVIKAQMIDLLKAHFVYMKKDGSTVTKSLKSGYPPFPMCFVRCLGNITI